MKAPVGLTVVILAVVVPLCLAKSIDNNSKLRKPEENEVLKDRAAPKPCCLPDSWTGKLKQVAGLVIIDDKELSEGEATLYQDLPNGRMAVDQTAKVKNVSVTSRLVINYKEGVMYTIVPATRSCVKAAGPMNASNCIPDYAEYTGSWRLGSKSASIMVDSWKVEVVQSGMDVRAQVTVTQDGCIPVTQMQYGRMNSALDFLVNQLFYDIEEGVKDKSVFDLPDYCDVGGTTGLREEHLMPKMQHMHEQHNIAFK